jgi:hypothetical protein
MVAIRQRQEIRDRPQHDPEPVFRKLQIPAHTRIEQADRVARRRVAKARMEVLGDRGAAQHGAALEHADVLSRAREIRGADEAVMSAADDDGVEFSRRGSHIVECGAVCVHP